MVKSYERLKASPRVAQLRGEVEQADGIVTDARERSGA